MQGELLLKVDRLTKRFHQFRAVDEISFEIREGETFALVGESGCGKSTTARCILRAEQPTAGEVSFRDAGGVWRDVARASKAELRRLRQEMQMVFQDPFSSLNPRKTLLEIIGEPLVVNRIAKGRAVEDRVAALLLQVGLKPEYMRRYPHAFSGGQRQRVGIARALAMKPRLIVADESVSALDVSVQAQVLNLLQDLQEQTRVAYLFVSHDLSVVSHISDRVAVMYMGQIVEIAPTKAIFERPRSPYTAALLAAVPRFAPGHGRERAVLSGEVTGVRPNGCAFNPRCPFATDLCRSQEPGLTDLGGGHFARCHYAETLELGVG